VLKTSMTLELCLQRPSFEKPPVPFCAARRDEACASPLPSLPHLV